MEKKIQGLQLYDIWDNLSNEAWYHFMLDFAKVERRMTGAEFSVLGSLYFKRDLPSETRRTSLPLIDKDGVTNNDNGYCIGPSVNAGSGHRCRSTEVPVRSQSCSKQSTICHRG